jgi:hypothetical protein
MISKPCLTHSSDHQDPLFVMFRSLPFIDCASYKNSTREGKVALTDIAWGRHSRRTILPLITPNILPRFCFESFWTHMLGYLATVSKAWNREAPANLNQLPTLHTKLCRTAKALRSWSKSLIPHGKVALVVCREVIAQLEKAQGHKQINQGECSLVHQLKLRILGLSAIEKCKARQKSRIT